ncbi:MAG: hypothetical protein U0R49_02345 [Fimbriimonadales bacterium]
MKISRITTVVGVAAIVALAIAQDSTVLIRRELKENTSDAYKMVIKTNQTIDAGGMQMPIDVTATADLGLKTLKINAEKKEGELEIKMSNLKVDMGDMAGAGGGGDMMGELPKEIITKATIDERNRIKMEAPKTGEGNSNNMMQMMGMMSGMGDPTGTLGVEFPEKAIKVGDSWEVPVPKNPMLGDVTAKLNAKLVAEKELNGVKVYEILITGKIPVDVDTEKLAKANPQAAAQNPFGGMQMIMKGTVDTSTTMLVSKTTGVTLSVESTQKSNINVEMTAQGMTITTAGTTKVSITKQ